MIRRSGDGIQIVTFGTYRTFFNSQFPSEQTSNALLKMSFVVATHDLSIRRCAHTFDFSLYQGGNV